jgi:hypothetical protein
MSVCTACNLVVFCDSSCNRNLAILLLGLVIIFIMLMLGTSKHQGSETEEALTCGL